VGSFFRQILNRRSRSQTLYHPAIRIVTPITQPVVEPVLPLQPELHHFRNDSIAAPMPGAGDISSFESPGRILEPLLQEGTVLDDLALRGRMGFDLMPPRTLGEIGVGFGGAQRLHSAFDPHLAG